jgi:hypothetical protein
LRYRWFEADKVALSANRRSRRTQVSGRHATCKPRKKREVEDDQFAKACGRFLAALERRASVNPDGLAYMLTLQQEMKEAVERAGYLLQKEGGFSLGEIAQFMTFNGHKMSRQAAQQRWGAAAIAAKIERRQRVLDKLNNVVRLTDWRAMRAQKESTDDARKLSRAV